FHGHDKNGRRELPKAELLPLLGHKGQATTELAIMGAVVIMVLSYLLQQGFTYNCRQSLEMYTFRKALQLSRQQEKGISLQVIRDVIVPSFFTGLNRQRFQSVAVIDRNSRFLYIPSEDEPEHVGTRQLIQLNEAMIRNNYFFEIPPTKIKIERSAEETTENPVFEVIENLLSGGGGDVEPEWQWVESSVRNFASPTENITITPRRSDYTYTTKVREDKAGKTVSKILTSKDTIPFTITFENEQEIIDSYKKGDDKIISVDVDEATIPKNVNLILEETVERTRDVFTPFTPP
ncbi:MAG: hypothetical protein QMD94_02775, partial [Candidatus Omnitrophota bacterium]|nr:hypothetical protein [Candidatus Omnitrophota bacterium]